MSSTLFLSPEQIAEARTMREDGDKTYAQLSKHFGVSVADLKDALAGVGAYAPVEAPKTALDQLQATAEAQAKPYDVSEDPDVRAANADRKLTEDEIESINLAAGVTAVEHRRLRRKLQCAPLVLHDQHLDAWIGLDEQLARVLAVDA